MGPSQPGAVHAVRPASRPPVSNWGTSLRATNSKTIRRPSPYSLLTPGAA